MSDEQPTIGHPVVLRDQGGRDHPSRVEGVETDLVIVARPDDLLVDEAYGPGTELVVMWAAPTGLRALPTELVDTSTANRVRVWRLRVTGTGWGEQRREYVRVPISGPVTIELELLGGADGYGAPDPAVAAPTFLSDAEIDAAAAAGAPDVAENDDALHGQLLDISEAALAAQVQADRDDPRLGEGSRVIVSFRLHADEYELPATIHSARSLSGGRDHRIVAVFRHGRGHADSIRQHVFAIQREIMQLRRR